MPAAGFVSCFARVRPAANASLRRIRPWKCNRAESHGTVFIILPSLIQAFEIRIPKNGRFRKWNSKSLQRRAPRRKIAQNLALKMQQSFAPYPSAARRGASLRRIRLGRCIWVSRLTRVWPAAAQVCVESGYGDATGLRRAALLLSFCPF